MGGLIVVHIVEVMLTFVFDVLVYIVSYYTGKIFTLGKYSSEGCNNSHILLKPLYSFPITNAEENKKYISFDFTCVIGFLFWVVSVTTFIIVK